MFSKIEKVVLTLLTSFVVLLAVAVGFHAAGIEEIANYLLAVALTDLGAGIVLGFAAFMRWLWCDA